MRQFTTTLALVLGLCCSLTLSAQHICGVHPGVEGFGDHTERLRRNISAAADGAYVLRDVMYVPIQFHLGARSDGSGRISEMKILDQLCELNEDFAEYDIQYFLADGTINYINNTTFYENHSNTESGIMSISKNNRAINVYIVESANTGSNPGEGVTLAYYNIPRDWIVITRSYIRDNDATLTHEIGHFFSLNHTFNGWECGGFNEVNTPAPTIPSCGTQFYPPTERANGSNCATAGDLVCDTPADYNNGIGWQGCDFTLNVLDPQGNAIDPDERNYLSYFLNCDDNDYHFSDQQTDIMHADLASSGRNFLRLDPVPNVPILGEDVTTTLVSPINNETTEAYNTVLFEWDPVPGATAYVLEISLAPTFTILPRRAIVYGNSKVMEDFDSDRRYYWRVRPFNALSGCASSSSSESFRTGTVVKVSAPDFASTLRVYPNPVNANTALTVSLDTEEAIRGTLTLVDMTGRAVAASQAYDLAAGSHQINYPVGQTPTGLYLLQVTSDQGTVTRKVLVGR